MIRRQVVADGLLRLVAPRLDFTSLHLICSRVRKRMLISAWEVLSKVSRIVLVYGRMENLICPTSKLSVGQDGYTRRHLEVWEKDVYRNILGARQSAQEQVWGFS